MYFLVSGKRKDLQTSQPKKGSRLKLYYIPVVLIAGVAVVWYTYVLITGSSRYLISNKISAGQLSKYALMCIK